MLLLTRKVGERIVIGSGPRKIVITLTAVDRGRGTIGITAPRDVAVFREELVPQIELPPDDKEPPP